MKSVIGDNKQYIFLHFPTCFTI